MEKSPDSKILIRVNAQDLQFFLETVLFENHFFPVAAMTTEDALEKIILEKPVMIVLDVMMERDQGMALYRQLKRHEKYKSIPVIMLSTLDRDAFFQLHHIEYTLPRKGLPQPEGYLFKPPEAAELIETIETILSRPSTRSIQDKDACY